MRYLKWDASHAVFLTEIDDEHKEIFQALADLQEAVSSQARIEDVCRLAERLTLAVGQHFAHEERLMRAARYRSIDWHRRLHLHARRRVRQFVARLETGDLAACRELVEYLMEWLDNHTRLADMMLGAFLRNEMRACTMSFRTGTQPMEACEWVDSSGAKFNPSTEA